MKKTKHLFMLFASVFAINVNAQESSPIPKSFENAAVPTTTEQQSTVAQPEAEKEKLDEVVVTALGIKRDKKSLGYAVQEVSGSTVNEAKDANFINSLSGKISGLDISRNNAMGASSNVIIRGFKSLNGNNQALFVVDGVPIDNGNTNTNDQRTGRGGYDFGNAASDINPDDIESISVLKGAAATALYGSRAANGVVLISTKKKVVKKGLGVTFSSSYTAGTYDPNTFIKYQNKYGAGYGDGYGNPGNDFFMGTNGTKLVVPLTEDASWGAKFDPNLQVYTWSSFVPESANFGKSSSWQAATNDPSKFFETSHTLSNNIGLETANDKGSMKLSYTNFNQTGIMPNSNLKKNTVYFNANYEIFKNLTASVVGNFVNQSTTGRYTSGYSDNIMTSFRQWWQTNTDILELKDIYNATKKNYSWNPSSETDKTPIYWDNPYWVRNENYTTDSRNRFYGNTQLDYKIDEHFSAMARVTFDVYSTIQEERINKGSNPVSKYSRLDKTYSEYNYDAILNYKNKFGKDFDFSALIGSNIRVQTISSILSETNGGLNYDRFYALSNSINALQPSTEEYQPQQVNGFFGSASFGYQNYLYLDVTGRIDQSSTLPVASNTYFYPSVSAGFVFSELLNRMSTLPSWMSFGKLRANYAMVGNSAPVLSIKDVYRFGDPVTQSNNPSFNGVPLMTLPTTKNNSNLKSEKTINMELGLEMAFLKNRIGFDIALYKTNTVDQIQPVRVSSGTGYNFKFVNSGEIENKGIEISLNAKPIQTKDFQWAIIVNWNKNVNKVISLYEGVDNLQLGSFQGGVTLNATVGESYGAIKGTDYIYAPDGQKVVKSNGFYDRTTKSDITIGNINPDWKGGITNKFTYKDFSLSFLIDIKKGGNLFSLDRYYGLATGLPAETAANNELGNPLRDAIVKNADGTYASNSGGILLDGVVKNADGTYSKNTTRANTSEAGGYGAFGYSKNPNKAFVYDASYVKLREISLSYNLNAKYLPKFMQALTVSLIARNVWIIYKNLPDSDPEEGLSSGNLQGYQSGANPTVREIGGRLTVKF